MHDAMKAYGGVDLKIHIFLTLALAGGEWSASHPGRFTPAERASGTHCIGGSVDPRAGMDGLEKRKFLHPPGLGTPTPRSSSPPPVVIPTTLSQLTSSAVLRVTIFWHLTPCDLVAEVCGFGVTKRIVGKCPKFWIKLSF
jgi:hypothetical protein